MKVDWRWYLGAAVTAVLAVIAATQAGEMLGIGRPELVWGALGIGVAGVALAVAVEVLRARAGRRARPMVRTIVGVIITLVCLGLDHSLGIGAGVVTGVWVLLGIGSVIRAAADKPTEHRVQLGGAVAHVVVEASPAGSPQLPRPLQGVAQRASVGPVTADRRREKLIACPRCSQYVLQPATTCTCGWVVPEAASGGPVVRKLDTAAESPEVVGIEVLPCEQQTASRPRGCPACPQCRAPTQWVSEFERFFCSRCDAYL